MRTFVAGPDALDAGAAAALDAGAAAVLDAGAAAVLDAGAAAVLDAGAAALEELEPDAELDDELHAATVSATAVRPSTADFLFVPDIRVVAIENSFRVVGRQR